MFFTTLSLLKTDRLLSRKNEIESSVQKFGLFQWRQLWQVR